GHAMRKLLHLVFAIWKSGRPFDRSHYPWETPARGAESDKGASLGSKRGDNGMSPESQAAGHKPDAVPAESVVTAACAASVVPQADNDESTFIDFAHLKQQLPLARVLDQLGLAARLGGCGARSPWPS